jgi:hypothetical protein
MWQRGTELHAGELRELRRVLRVFQPFTSAVLRGWRLALFCGCVLLPHSSGDVARSAVAWGTSMSPCGRPECAWHCTGPAEVCVTPGRRIRAEARASVCIARASLHVRGGVLRCRLPVRTTLTFRGAKPLVVRGDLRVACGEDATVVLVVEGVALDGEVLHPRGTALESSPDGSWQSVVWPRWTAQEAQDVMLWPEHIEPVVLGAAAEAPQRRDSDHPGRSDETEITGGLSAERWILARMLQRVHGFEPLSRTAVLALALERGSAGLRIATLQLLTDGECAWLLQLIAPLTEDPVSQVATCARAAWERGSPRGGARPCETNVDSSAWQAPWSARQLLDALRRARVLAEPWHVEASARLRAEEALDMTADFEPCVDPRGRLGPDRCFTDSTIRLWEASRRRWMQTRLHSRGAPSSIDVFTRAQARSRAESARSASWMPGMLRHWSTAGYVPTFSLRHWIPAGGELFP